MAEPTTPQQLELDLQAARSHGRWLSEDEVSEIEQQESARLLMEEQRQGRRLANRRRRLKRQRRYSSCHR